MAVSVAIVEVVKVGLKCANVRCSCRDSEVLRTERVNGYIVRHRRCVECRERWKTAER